ncbi:MAG: flagellar biosynthetic protein FliO [Burkholderiales bacterium]
MKGALVASGVGAGTSIPTLGVGGVLQAVFGLVLVLGVVFVFAWLARRLGWQRPGQASMVRIVGAAPLSQRERVVVVDVAGTWLVLGVAPGSVRRLHTMPAGETPPAAVSTAPAFSQALRRQLADRLGGKTDRGGDR